MRLDVLRWIDDFEQRMLADYRAAIRDLVMAVAHQSPELQRQASAALDDLIARTMSTAEVLGATIALQQASGAYADDWHQFVADRGELLTFRDQSAGDVLPRVEFDESIQDMIDRTPVTLRAAAVRVGEQIARLYGQGRVVAFARATEQAVTEKVQALIVQGMREGWAEGDAGERIRIEVGKLVDEADGWTDAYARTVFRTNVSTAVNAGRFRQAADPDVQAVVPAGRFEAVGDSDTRPNHMAADGRIWLVTHPVWQRLAPPLGYNCFLPQNRVCGAIRAASKARYSGPAVEIKTANGGWLAVTVNHPILTPSGWKPAGKLAEGDQLVSDCAAVESLSHGPWDGPLAEVSVGRRAEHDQHMPPRAEQVFDHLAADAALTGRSLRLRPLPLDLHGDALFVHGEVDIVRADGVLPPCVDAPGGEEQQQVGLKLGDDSANSSGHGGGCSGKRLGGSLGPANSLPCSGALACDGVSRLWSALDAGPLHLLGIGSAAQSDARTSEAKGDGPSADAELFGELLHAHASQVATDEVVELRRFQFDGHVYDFQTAQGWIVAGGIVTSNCRCHVSLVTRPELVRMGRVRPDGSIVEDPVPPGAFPDPGFRHDVRPDLGVA